MRKRIALWLAAALLAGCSEEIAETEEYQQGYDNGYADAASEMQVQIDEMQSAIDASQDAVEDARASLSTLQDAASETTDQADRFDYEDWSYVVGDVRSAAETTQGLADSAGYSIDEIENALSDY